MGAGGRRLFDPAAPQLDGNAAHPIGAGGTGVASARTMSGMRSPWIAVSLGTIVLGLTPSALAQAPVALAERARGAERVVVGRVTAVSPRWQVNDFGDRLIVSTVRVAVSETLKGEPAPVLDVEVEGGTIGTLTLHVSDQASLSPGERATFFVRRDRRGTFVPHLRGQGVLKLDSANRVPGSALTLEQIRREIAAGRQR